MESSVQTTFNEGGAEITVINETNISGASGLLNVSMIDEIRNMTNVSDVAGELQVIEIVNTSLPSQSPLARMTVYGLDSSKLNLIGIKNVNGSVYEENSTQAIVGKYYCEKNNISIGDNLTIYGKNFDVVGIYETGAMYKDNSVYVSLDKLQNINHSLLTRQLYILSYLKSRNLEGYRSLIKKLGIRG